MAVDRIKEPGPLLAIDIGNSTIIMGCVEDDNILFEERVATRADKTKIEYAMLMKSMLELNNINEDRIKGVIISSVVPPLTNVIKTAAEMVTRRRPLVIGPGIKTGLPIHMDDPKSVGCDLIVAAVAVSCEYGCPAIIIDVGTATTITVVDESGAYIGGVIMPGVVISQEALAARTAQLPHISIDTPSRVVAKNTIESIRSGAIYGSASGIDGIIERIKEEMGFSEDVTIVATGGIAGSIIPYCKTKNIIYDKVLLLKGMKIIYERNKKI